VQTLVKLLASVLSTTFSQLEAEREAKAKLGQLARDPLVQRVVEAAAQERMLIHTGLLPDDWRDSTDCDGHRIREMHEAEMKRNPEYAHQYAVALEVEFAELVKSLQKR